jgi:hypothetical protein
MRNITDRLHEPQFQQMTIEREKELAKDLIEAKKNNDTKQVALLTGELKQREQLLDKQETI